MWWQVFSNMTLTGDMFNGSSNRTADTGGANLLMGGPGAGGPPTGFQCPAAIFLHLRLAVSRTLPAGCRPWVIFHPPGSDMPPIPEGGFDMPTFGGPARKEPPRDAP